LNFDFIVVGVDETHSTPRPPCSPLNDGSGPFDGVKGRFDATSPLVDMCVGGAFNTAHLGFPPTGSFNSEILNDQGGHVGTTIELYAQTFAFVAAANPSDYLDPQTDGVFQHSSNSTPKAWFSCTLAKARQRAIGTGSIDSSCNIAVPAWYATLIGPGH